MDWIPNTLGIRRRARHNTEMANGRPLKLIAPSASAEEAAAIVAALERFMRATAPTPVPAAEGPEPWTRTAILEGASRHPGPDDPDPWINT
jgi:hypothetical protein